MKPEQFAAADPFARVVAGPFLAQGEQGWGDPSPLCSMKEGEPYPVDALPPVIGDAVAEVRGYTGAPVALVAASALSALSLAGQGLADVARDGKLVGPCGLYLLTVAESGERKSTCDGYFAKPIAEWERDEAERLRPLAQAAERERAIWAAKRAGFLDAVKRAAKAPNVDTSALEGALRDLGPEPEGVRVPSLRHTDGGPEALGFALATEWPSAAVLSAEGGAVLGSHGMNAETIMRTLALWNVLWDGGTHTVRRRTSADFTVRGARLTVGLMVQPATLREFMGKSGPLARGSGFLARYLIAAPHTTQGDRPYVEPPASWPALDRFHGRLRAMLETPLPWDGGGLAPSRLSFAADAKAEWVDAFNAVERELCDGGKCADVRDVASKALDNAARLAGLFHLAEHGPGGVIGYADAVRGIRLAVWYLGEARRVLNEVAPPSDVLDALELEEWIAEQSADGEPASRRDAQQFGPVRKPAALRAALAVLEARDRARVMKVGKQKLIVLNPMLAEAGA